MSAPPLTHHDILNLVEPFVQMGRRLDLEASDRLQRRLVFQRIEHAADSPTLPPLGETLELYSFGTGTCCLTRTLTLASGLKATLEATGTQVAELLTRINAVPASRQLRLEPGYAIARSYSLPAHAAVDCDARGAAPVLTRAVAQLDGLTLTLDVSPVRGVAAEVALLSTPGSALAIPQDLLAVLGWDWARLIAHAGGWRSKLRLRGGRARRTRAAEIALDRAAAHLARTLAEPPARFHERWLAARWGVVLRRGIPSLTFLVLLLVVLTLHRSIEPSGPGVWMLLFQVPTALIAWSFCLQELPQYEIPPWPRRPAAASWGLTRAQPQPGARIDA